MQQGDLLGRFTIGWKLYSSRDHEQTAHIQNSVFNVLEDGSSIQTDLDRLKCRLKMIEQTLKHY